MENKQATASLSDKQLLDAEELWQVAWTYIRTVVDTLREPFLVMDENLKIISANRTFYAVFQVTPEETEGKRVYDLGNGQWNIPKLKILLEDILPKNTHFDDFKVKHEFPKIGHRIMILNARRIYKTGVDKPIMLLAMEDVTKQFQLEEQLKEYTKTLTLEVAKRTAELEKRVKELERINKVMIGREIKMIELKREIEKLKKNIK
jgi:chemotaxis protein methyltransferase CheR